MNLLIVIFIALLAQNANSNLFLPGRDKSYCTKSYVSQKGDTWQSVGQRFQIDYRLLAFKHRRASNSVIAESTKLCVDGWY